jgi:hypothetical protein
MDAAQGLSDERILDSNGSGGKNDFPLEESAQYPLDVNGMPPRP